MASLIAPADLRVFPEFADTNTVTDPFLQECIDNADLEINADAWGDRAELAEKYLAMHYASLLLRKNGGAAGAQTGTRVGDVAVQYANPVSSLVGTGIDASLQATSYGLNYLRLCKLSGMGIAVTGGC